jgi:hypothetical protein
MGIPPAADAAKKAIFGRQFGSRWIHLRVQPAAYPAETRRTVRDREHMEKFHRRKLIQGKPYRGN